MKMVHNLYTTESGMYDVLFYIVCLCICVYMFVCVYAFVFMCACVFIYLCVHMQCMCVCICTCVCVCVCVCVFPMEAGVCIEFCGEGCEWFDGEHCRQRLWP